PRKHKLDQFVVHRGLSVAGQGSESVRLSHSRQPGRRGQKAGAAKVPRERPILSPPGPPRQTDCARSGPPRLRTAGEVPIIIDNDAAGPPGLNCPLHPRTEVLPMRSRLWLAVLLLPWAALPAVPADKGAAADITWKKIVVDKKFRSEGVAI